MDADLRGKSENSDKTLAVVNHALRWSPPLEGFQNFTTTDKIRIFMHDTRSNNPSLFDKKD